MRVQHLHTFTTQCTLNISSPSASPSGAGWSRRIKTWGASSASICGYFDVKFGRNKCPFKEFQGCNSFGPVNGVLGPRVSVCIHIHQDMLALSSGLLVTNPPSNFIKPLPVMLCAHSTSANTKHENHRKTQFLSWTWWVLQFSTRSNPWIIRMQGFPHQILGSSPIFGFFLWN